MEGIVGVVVGRCKKYVYRDAERPIEVSRYSVVKAVRESSTAFSGTQERR